MRRKRRTHDRTLPETITPENSCNRGAITHDSRDAEVMASALRTGQRCFRLLVTADPTVIELRKWSRIAEDLNAERNRLTIAMAAPCDPSPIVCSMSPAPR
jgi:hypothetical protein